MSGTTEELVPADWPHREHSRFVSVGALDWHVQVAGTGPTLVLLHGSGSSGHSWADLVPTLMGCATLVIPDLPGHGFTRGATRASLTLPQIALALDALLTRLELAPARLVVGHSAGAALALRWALDSTRPPRSLVGFNASLIPPPAAYQQLLAPLITPVATSHWATSLLAGLSSQTRVIDRLLDSTQSAIPEWQRARYARLFSDPAHVRGTMGLMAGADLVSILRGGERLGIPLTFVLGTVDRWVPCGPLRKIVEESFGTARIVAWEGGHLLHEAEPLRAAQLILEVLAGVA